MVLLQEVAGVMSFWTFLGYLVILATFFGTIWALYSAFSSKANKKDIEDALSKKLDVTRYEDYRIHIQGELDRHDLLFEKMNERADDEAAEREEIRELLARIDERTEFIAKNCPKNRC
jgi:hypothetical protein